MIHLSDKMSDAFPRLGDASILIEMNFLFLERSYQLFGVSVLPRTPSANYRNLNIVRFEHREIRL